MSPPALTMAVPIRALADLEQATLRLWMVTNKVVSELEAGEQTQPLLALLKDELGGRLPSLASGEVGAAGRIERRSRVIDWLGPATSQA